MTSQVRHLAFFFILLIVCTVLPACGPSNSVRLIYKPGPSAILPQPEAPRLTVVMFDDQRSNQAIGERRDGTSFVAASLVSDWASRSLGDELARLGSQVSYATTLAQARSANPEYIVSGVIREVWLKENNPTSLSATIRMTVTLADRTRVLYSENLSASQERQYLPSSSVVESLLSDTLRDLLVPAAKKIQNHLR